MATLRRATPQDAALITHHRHIMFAENHPGIEDRLAEMEAAFLPWVQERLSDGRYVGFLIEEEGICLAGSGIFFGDFPPHFLHVQPCRPYLLNFYTAESARGRGFAKQMLQACIDECTARGFSVITLHASRFGRPIYERFGFEPTNEMMLKTSTAP